MRRALRWFDSRLGVTHFTRSALNKIFPDNWSFMIGEIALYSFVVLVVTGTYLTFFYTPSAQQVVYRGSYAPLHGVTMSAAYESTLRLSFDVRAGLVFRQMHHWAALVFIGAIVVHLCRIFFTGAFRRPREINWLVGVTMLVLAMFNGFSGYSLPDDLLSGTGLRIAYSIMLAVPVIGTWAAFLVFGGEFPASDIIGRLFILHVLLVPGLLLGLLGAHMAILWRQKHTQFPGPGRREDNIVGSRLWPTYAIRSLGLFAAVFGVVAALGGLAQINPVWLYGPFKPSSVSTAAQPDWYMGFLEGALRLFPFWRAHIFGYTVSELFWPGVLLPGVTFALLFAWPFVERRATGDRNAHQLLDRPREHPVRTPLGIAVLTFYFCLFVGGSDDLIAQHLSASIPTVVWTMRVLTLTAPLAAFFIARQLCHELVETEHREDHKDVVRARYLHGPASDRIVGTVTTPGRPANGDGRRLTRWLGAAGVALAAVLGSFRLGRRRGARASGNASSVDRIKL